MSELDVAPALDLVNRMGEALRARPAEVVKVLEALRGGDPSVPDPAFLYPQARRASVIADLASRLGLTPPELLILAKIVEHAGWGDSD